MIKFKHLLVLYIISNTTLVYSSDYEKEKVKYFSIWSLSTSPIDKSNRFINNSDAISLGKKLFFDPKLSQSGKISCSSCHVTDGEFVPNESVPANVSRKFRTTMSIEGAAYGKFFFWDGRSDSLWSLALEPIENPDEHNFPRALAVQYLIQNYFQEITSLLKSHKDLSSHLDIVIESLDSSNSPSYKNSLNHIFSVIGKSIAAYISTISITSGEWDITAKKIIDNQPLNEQDKNLLAGFKIFSGKARCSNCHTGPLFSDKSFHNTGMPVHKELGFDAGRYAVINKLRTAEFGCLSSYSDAKKEDCSHITQMNISAHKNFGNFKTASLRGVQKRERLGHSGQFYSIEDMLSHYESARPSPLDSMLGQGSLSELRPFTLTKSERDSLLAFLKSL